MRDATVARRYHPARRGATSAAIAQVTAPNTIGAAGIAQPRGPAIDATIAVGAIHDAAAATCVVDGRRGNRHRTDARTQASAPNHKTAAWLNRIPASVARRAGVHGWSEKWCRSTPAGSMLRP